MAKQQPLPIMEYVYDLEERLRNHRTQDRHFNARIFVIGFVIGAASCGLLWILSIWKK